MSAHLFYISEASFQPDGDCWALSSFTISGYGLPKQKITGVAGLTNKGITAVRIRTAIVVEGPRGRTIDDELIFVDLSSGAASYDHTALMKVGSEA